MIVVPLKRVIFLCPKISRDRFLYEGGKQIPLIRRRVKVVMACTECKQRNYNTTKNKKNDPDRLEMKKYCKFCRKHTLHRESK